MKTRRRRLKYALHQCHMEETADADAEAKSLVLMVLPGIQTYATCEKIATTF